MKTKVKTLSEKRINRLRAQGYTRQTNEELNRMAFGIRFAYRSCVVLLSVAVITQSVAMFAVMLGIAFMGIVLPNHPFDYVYNHILRTKWNKPRLPFRSVQLKFACSIATGWIAMVILLMTGGHTTAGTVMAVVLIGIALLPSTVDYCVPSAIFNALFHTRIQKV